MTAVDEKAPSFWLRALVAFGFAFAFHAVVLTAIGAFVVAPLFVIPDGFPPWVLAVALLMTSVAGWSALRAVVLVKDPFRPPGRALAPQEHAALQRLVHDVARELGAAPPERIYLLPDTNAHAVEVRGPFGLRRRRLLLLGLALVETCTVAELRGAVAHELAHFIGGDTALAPVLARVRMGLLRLHEELEGSLLYVPFFLYADAFLRMTQSISRQQELWADRAAARVAGRDAHARLLERQATIEALFTLLLRSGVNVLVASGFRPKNLYEGLRRLERSSAHDDEVRALLETRQLSPYDSHPPFDARLAHVRALEDVGAPSDVRPARELLDDPDRTEERLTREMFEERGHLQLVPIEWDDVAARAIRPALEEGARSAREDVARMFGREHARTDEAALRTLLEMLARSKEHVATATPEASAEEAIADTLRRATIPHVAALFARALLRRGGVLTVDIGRPFVISLNDKAYRPEALAEEAVYHPAAAGGLMAELDALPPPEVSRPVTKCRGID